MLNIALPKGRLGNQAYKLLSAKGYECREVYEDTRKLVYESKENGVRYFLVKPSDVGIYVAHGAADLGIVGKDVIMETSPDVYELLDLGFGKCKMAVAAPMDYVENTEKTLRVATKFITITKNYYSSISREVNIIKLHGSIELAPILGLSDVIVDLVESGKTLKENNLHIIKELYPISARLIANKSSFRFKNALINELLGKL